jgi:hypothetical protein
MDEQSVVATTKPTEPFTMIPNWIVRDANLSQNAVMVYLALCSRKNTDGICWPSQNLLAKEARCSSTSVKRALKELRVKEFIDWAIRLDEKTNEQQSNVYKVLTPPVHHDLPPGSQWPTPQVTMAYKEEPLNKEPAKKNKVQNTLNVSFAADDEKKPKYVHRDDKLGSDKQVQLVRDAFILLHNKTPGKNYTDRWKQNSSAALNAEIKEYWHEIESYGDDGLADLTDDVYSQLSSKSQSYVDKRIGERSPTTPPVLGKPTIATPASEELPWYAGDPKKLTAFEGMFAATDNFSF